MIPNCFAWAKSAVYSGCRGLQNSSSGMPLLFGRQDKLEPYKNKLEPAKNIFPFQFGDGWSLKCQGKSFGQGQCERSGCPEIWHKHHNYTWFFVDFFPLCICQGWILHFNQKRPCSILLRCHSVLKNERTFYSGPFPSVSWVVLFYLKSLDWTFACSACFFFYVVWTHKKIEKCCMLSTHILAICPELHCWAHKQLCKLKSALWKLHRNVAHCRGCPSAVWIIQRM